jgi:hypothetical protein
MVSHSSLFPIAFLGNVNIGIPFWIAHTGLALLIVAIVVWFAHFS